MLRGHSNSVQQPVFASDGETLYTASHDGTAIAWDLTGDRRLGRPFVFTHDRTFSAEGYDGHPGRFSPDGRLIAVGLRGRGVALWDARELKQVGTPLLETGGEVKSLAFSPDGRTLRPPGLAETRPSRCGMWARMPDSSGQLRAGVWPSASARTDGRLPRRAALASPFGTRQPERLSAPWALGSRAISPLAPTDR
jgi:WD40 repeat protein